MGKIIKFDTSKLPLFVKNIDVLDGIIIIKLNKCIIETGELIALMNKLNNDKKFIKAKVLADEFDPADALT